MANCSDLQVATLESSRLFFSVPDSVSCGRKIVYYGPTCELAELDGLTEPIRSGSDPIRAWNRKTNTYCTVGNKKSPPGIEQVTIRFKEVCQSGIPFAMTLDNCRARAIVTHGGCKDGSNFLSGWSHYTEVVDFQVISRNSGKRNSYDAMGDERVIELTAEVNSVHRATSVNFSQLNIASGLGTTAGCSPASFMSNQVTYLCSTGCGDSECGCQSSCNDGTQVFYVPFSCTGSPINYLYYTLDGGTTFKPKLIDGNRPATSVATMYPKSAVVGNRLYVMAYESPPVLYSIALDDHGTPYGAISMVAVLGNTTGKPAELIADGDTLHILVEDAVNGSRYYRLDYSYDPSRGPLNVFDIPAEANKMSVCGDNLIVGGKGGAIYTSGNGGVNWTADTAPVSYTETTTAVGINDGRYWIGSQSGLKYIKQVSGTSGWTPLSITGSNSQINGFYFTGDDVGWMLDQNAAPFSTWVGGTNGREWTNASPRLSAFPAGFNPVHAAIPHCAPGYLAPNTAIITGTASDGTTKLFVGKPKIAGI